MIEPARKSCRVGTAHHVFFQESPRAFGSAFTYLVAAPAILVLNVVASFSLRRPKPAATRLICHPERSEGSRIFTLVPKLYLGTQFWPRLGLAYLGLNWQEDSFNSFCKAKLCCNLGSQAQLGNQQ
jgi:hypothetical protein